MEVGRDCTSNGNSSKDISADKQVRLGPSTAPHEGGGPRSGPLDFFSWARQRMAGDSECELDGVAHCLPLSNDPLCAACFESERREHTNADTEEQDDG